jgi:sugar phosphate isomerase/epimerase
LTRLVVEDQIRTAAAIGATGFVFASGADVPPDERPAARKAFANFCRWFCGALKPHGITALLEPFDRTIDKKFLYGPTAECVELIESLGPEVDNIGIELDIAHLPLMGESPAQGFRTTAPYLKRVHLGNCVLKDTSSSWYGDKHPPVGLPGGEIDTPQLEEVLRLCLDLGYLNRENRGALVFEMQPFPGKTPDQTVQDSLDRLYQAWARV